MSTLHARRHRLRVGAVALAGALGAGLVATAAPASAAPPSADLSVAVTHNPSSPKTGDDLTFTLTATNDGPDPAEATVVGLAVGYPFELVDDGTTPSCEAVESEGASVICTMGDIPSGSSAVATIVVVPHGAGVFQIPAAAASDTPDPDTADRAATDTVIVQQGPTRYEQATDVVYQQVLGRHASTAEQEYWGQAWQSAPWPNAYRVPLAIILGPESRARRIKAAYLRILGRAASPSDVTYWSGRMAKGMTFETLELNLINSYEYFRPVSDDVYAAITKVFTTVLHRNPRPGEVDYWQPRLGGRSPLLKMATTLQYSNEGRTWVMNQRYQLVLGRAPQDFDRLVWLSDLQQRVATSDGEWAKLYSGGEFLSQFYDYYGPEYDPGQVTSFPSAPLEAALASR